MTAPHMSSSLSPPVHNAAIAYDNIVKQCRHLSNTLEIHNYLLQQDARVDIVNFTRHRGHYRKYEVIHRTGST